MGYTKNWTFDAHADAKSTTVEFNNGTAMDMTLAVCNLIRNVNTQLLHTSEAEAKAFQLSLKAAVMIDSFGLFAELKDGEHGRLHEERTVVSMDRAELCRQAEEGDA